MTMLNLAYAIMLQCLNSLVLFTIIIVSVSMCVCIYIYIYIYIY